MKTRTPKYRRPAPRITITCPTCGTQFIERPSRNRKYCSRACSGIAFARKYEAARVTTRCAHCGKLFRHGTYLKPKYCCLQCKQTYISRSTIAQRANKMRGRGRDGPMKSTTYSKMKGRHLHRVVAETVLGRLLLPGEIVHHIDGDLRNNEPENLRVMTQSEHAREHNLKRHAQRRSVLQAIESGAMLG